MLLLKLIYKYWESTFEFFFVAKTKGKPLVLYFLLAYFILNSFSFLFTCYVFKLSVILVLILLFYVISFVSIFYSSVTQGLNYLGRHLFASLFFPLVFTVLIFIYQLIYINFFSNNPIYFVENGIIVISFSNFCSSNFVNLYYCCFLFLAYIGIVWLALFCCFNIRLRIWCGVLYLFLLFNLFSIWFLYFLDFLTILGELDLNYGLVFVFLFFWLFFARGGVLFLFILLNISSILLSSPGVLMFFSLLLFLADHFLMEHFLFFGSGNFTAIELVFEVLKGSDYFPKGIFLTGKGNFENYYNNYYKALTGSKYFGNDSKARAIELYITVRKDFFDKRRVLNYIPYSEFSVLKVSPMELDIIQKEKNIQKYYITSFTPRNALDYFTKVAAQISASNNKIDVSNVELKGFNYSQKMPISKIKDYLDINSKYDSRPLKDSLNKGVSALRKDMMLLGSILQGYSPQDRLLLDARSTFIGGNLAYITKADMSFQCWYENFHFNEVYRNYQVLEKVDKNNITPPIVVSVLSDYVDFDTNNITYENNIEHRPVSFNTSARTLYRLVNSQSLNVLPNVSATIKAVAPIMVDSVGVGNLVCDCYATKQIFYKVDCETRPYTAGDLIVFTGAGKSLFMYILEYKYIPSMNIITHLLATRNLEFSFSSFSDSINGFIYSNIAGNLPKIDKYLLANGFDFASSQFIYQIGLDISLVERVFRKKFDIDFINSQFVLAITEKLLKDVNVPENIKALIREGKIIFKLVKV